MRLIKTKKTLFIGLGIVSVMSVIYIVSTASTTPQDNIPSQSIQEITPGVTTSEQVKNKLGAPLKESDWNNYKILNYKNDSEWNNQIYTKDNIVKLSIEQVATGSAFNKSDYLKEYGPTYTTFYGPLSPAFNMYAYLDKGFAMVAATHSNEIFQLWHFSPMSVSIFLSTIGQEHSYTNIPPQETE